MKTIIKKISLTSIFLFTIIMFGFGQKPILIEGDLSFLKGQTKINLQYDYNNISVNGYENEQDYINERVAKKNKKWPGSGDEWAKQWVDLRESNYQQNFEALFNQNMHLNMSAVRFGNFPDAIYTLILKTTRITPEIKTAGIGQGVGIPIPHIISKIYVEIWLVETSKKEEVFAKLKMYIKTRGYDESRRLNQAYSKFGASLAWYFCKKKLFKS